MPLLLEQAWRLSDSVSLRPEPFGAMAYDFATRRLSFLKSRPLVAVVELLAGCATVEEALAAAGIPDGQRPRYLRALEELAASGILVPVVSPVVSPAPVPAGASA